MDTSWWQELEIIRGASGLLTWFKDPYLSRLRKPGVGMTYRNHGNDLGNFNG